MPVGVTFETPDGGTITPPAAGGDLSVDRIITEPGATSGNKVTLAVTATGNVDIYASDDPVNWTSVATNVAASPFVEDDLADTKRFYVIVTAGEDIPSTPLSRSPSNRVIPPAGNSQAATWNFPWRFFRGISPKKPGRKTDAKVQNFAEKIQ